MGIIVQQRNGMSKLSFSVSLAPAWNPAHQELNLDQGYSFIHRFLCMSEGLDKHSLPFLLQANLKHLKSDFDGIKEKIGLLIR